MNIDEDKIKDIYQESIDLKIMVETMISAVTNEHHPVELEDLSNTLQI